jgi:hypothetical protein
VKSEGATEVAPSIETVARCDGASSLALAGYLSFGLSANLALSESYNRVAVNGKHRARGYPQPRLLAPKQLADFLGDQFRHRRAVLDRENPWTTPTRRII